MEYGEPPKLIPRPAADPAFPDTSSPWYSHRVRGGSWHFHPAIYKIWKEEPDET
jgi:hypothetical protein